MKKEKMILGFEKMLWRVRYLVLFPVVFLIIALIYLIILMGERLIDATQSLAYKESPFEVLVYLIDIVDFTLIAVIILLIIWGVYELFIRPMSIDIHNKVKADSILIHDIDELKQKLGKVIIISLVVHIFKQILVAKLIEPMELLIGSGAVLLLAGALFLVEKLGSSGCEDECDQEHHLHNENS